MKEVIVWSKDRCMQCNEAKALLKLKGIAFEERSIDKGFTREQFMQAVPNARSFPQIIADGELIGGYQELLKRL